MGDAFASRIRRCSHAGGQMMDFQSSGPGNDRFRIDSEEAKKFPHYLTLRVLSLLKNSCPGNIRFWDTQSLMPSTHRSWTYSKLYYLIIQEKSLEYPNLFHTHY